MRNCYKTISRNGHLEACIIKEQQRWMIGVRLPHTALRLCMAGQQLWQARKNENNNRHSEVTQRGEGNFTINSMSVLRSELRTELSHCFGILQTPRVDSCTLITETLFFTSGGKQQLGVDYFGGRRRKKIIAQFGGFFLFEGGIIFLVCT